MLAYLTSLLTVAFVVLKITGYIHWPWWVVFSPVLAVLVLIVIGFIMQFTLVVLSHRQMKRR